MVVDDIHKTFQHWFSSFSFTCCSYCCYSLIYYILTTFFSPTPHPRPPPNTCFFLLIQRKSSQRNQQNIRSHKKRKHKPSYLVLIRKPGKRKKGSNSQQRVRGKPKLPFIGVFQDHATIISVSCYTFYSFWWGFPELYLMFGYESVFDQISCQMNTF